MNYTLFASESVAAGHPDKICDQISDAIVDAVLNVDPYGRAGVECLATHEHLTIAGEVTTTTPIDYTQIARETIRELGYTHHEYGFSDQSHIEVLIHEQSSDIALGVDNGGAGDQGMMFGYACNETPELMPMPITLAHALTRRMDEVRGKGIIDYLRPDGKSEVVVFYEEGKPTAVDYVVLAVPHKHHIEKEQLTSDLYQHVVKYIMNKYEFDVALDKFIVNGTGVWNIGGPSSDTGLTGRKIIADTYGGMGRHGGGCKSGKDPTKVDRSAAYATRYIAKNIVAAGLAERCEVKVVYVIGHKYPIARAIDTFGTNLVSLEKIEEFAWDLLDLSVGGIIEALNLRQPIYKKTACYGHFGRTEFPWERIAK
jgi:S-adenosylmethionine synthetase